jgi:hypothetical protein
MIRLLFRPIFDLGLKFFRHPDTDHGMKRGKPFYLYSHEQIDQVIYWSALFERKAKVSAELHAEFTRDGRDLAAKQAEYGVTAADERVVQLRRASDEIAWALATTAPTSMAGVAAVLRYANEYEDGSDEWNIDTIQSEEWHYQLRQTAAKRNADQLIPDNDGAGSGP